MSNKRWRLNVKQALFLEEDCILDEMIIEFESLMTKTRQKYQA